MGHPTPFRARYLIALAGLCLATAGCDRLSFAGPPVSLASLDGAYRGEVVQRSGRPAGCLARGNLMLTMVRGEARGEVFDNQQPPQPIGSFYAFVEADARVKTTVRIGATLLAVDGRFDSEGFRGNAENLTCSMSITARRADAG